MFSTGDKVINVHTVGQLINELKLLPGSMRVDQDDDGLGVNIAVVGLPLLPRVIFAAGDQTQAVDAHPEEAA